MSIAHLGPSNILLKSPALGIYPTAVAGCGGPGSVLVVPASITSFSGAATLTAAQCFGGIVLTTGNPTAAMTFLLVQIWLHML